VGRSASLSSPREVMAAPHPAVRIRAAPRPFEGLLYRTTTPPSATCLLDELVIDVEGLQQASRMATWHREIRQPSGGNK